MKRMFSRVLLAVLACLALFAAENWFLAAFASVRPGMDKAQVKARLGAPWMAYLRLPLPGISGEQWEHAIGCDGEEWWRYTPGFLGIHRIFGCEPMGEWQVKFHQGTVVRTAVRFPFAGEEHKWPTLPLKLPSGGIVFLDSTGVLGVSASGERPFTVRYATAIPASRSKEQIAQMKEVAAIYQEEAEKAGSDVLLLTLSAPPQAPREAPEVLYETRQTAAGVEIVPVPQPKREQNTVSRDIVSYEIRKMPSGEWHGLKGFPW